MGFAGASLAWELEDGSLELIDRHARAEVGGDAIDPIGAMARVNSQKLEALLQKVSLTNDAVNAVLASVAHDARIAAAEEEPQSRGRETIAEKFQRVIDE